MILLLTKKKVDEIRTIIDRELGFLSSDKINEECVTFLYIQNKKVFGCLIAEPIEQAYEILSNRVKENEMKENENEANKRSDYNRED